MRLRHWRSLSLRFMLGRPGRALLMIAGIGLGAVLLTAMLSLGETLHAGAQKYISETYGSYNAVVFKKDLAALSAEDFKTTALEPEAVAAIGAFDQVRWQEPAIEYPFADARTPVNYYQALSPLPPGEFTGVDAVAGHYPNNAAEVMLTETLADRLGVTVGETIVLPFPSGERSLTVVGIQRTPDIPPPPTAYFEYEWLRSELGLPGPNTLLVGLAPGATSLAFAARVEEQFPDLAVYHGGGTGQIQQRLETFGLLGGILAVGTLLASLFLVQGSLGVTVQERVQELAMMRAIGTRPRQVAIILLAEVAMLSVIGAALGGLAGIGAAWAVTSVVGQVFDIPAHSLVIPFQAVGAVLGLIPLTTLVATGSIVRRAGRLAPLAAMRPSAADEQDQGQTRGWSGPIILMGSFLAAALSWTYAFSKVEISSWASMVSAGLLLLGVLIGLRRILPGTIILCARLLPARLHIATLIARRNMERHAAKAIRMSAMVLLAITLLIAVASSDQTEQRRYREDLTLWFPTEGRISASRWIEFGYDDDFVMRLASVQGVEAVYPHGAEFDGDLTGYDENRMSQERLNIARLRNEPPTRISVQYTDLQTLADVWQYGSVEGGLTGGALVSRRTAYNLGVQLGEQLIIQPVDGGPEIDVSIVGIVNNSPNSSGLVIDRSLMPTTVPGHYRVASVKIEPGADREHVRAEINWLLDSAYAAFSYEDQTDLIDWVVENQRQNRLMVGMTGLILLVAATVGFANIVSASIHERRRELAIVRAVGAGGRRVFQLIGVETLLLSMASTVLGVGTGVLMMVFYSLPVMRVVGLSAGLPVMPLEVLLPALVAGPILGLAASIAPVRAQLRKPLVGALHVE